MFGAVAVSVRAESLASVRTQAIASVNDASIQHLVVLGGRAIALGERAAWQLNDDRKAWTPLDWRMDGYVRQVVTDGQRAFLFLAPSNSGASDRVVELSSANGKLVLAALPSMPTAISSVNGALHKGTLYVLGVGGDGIKRFVSIKPSVDPPPWIELAPPSLAADVTSLVGQAGALYATVGSLAEPKTRLLRWDAEAGWKEKSAPPKTVLAGMARPSGQAHVLYLAQDGTEAAPTMITFHTITGSWAAIGGGDIVGADGARASAPFGNGLILRLPEKNESETAFKFTELEASQSLLRWQDWAVIIVYLLGMTGIGLYFYLQEKRVSTADFFVGSRSIPFWAAGVSLYATNTSSISYVAIPAKAFETNWQYLMNNLVAVVGLVFVAIWIVPLLRRLDLMSVFHYLETRFHPVIRMLSSALCIVMQLGSRMSVILFLPSLAISTVTGIDVVWSIWIMGVVTILYTALGGMKAVIWTDFVQLFVMFGGALFAIGFIIVKLDGGFGEFFAVAAAEDKMKLVDWSFDLTKATVWGFIFLVLFDVVLTFPKDQVLMQRTLSTKSAKDAGKSIWTFAAIMIPGGFMFYIIGTSLYVFYKTHPERLNPLLGVDATFPLFIAAELPAGVTGLIIAGILAASMSTLSSIMNSVATLASVDFFERFATKPSPKASVLFAEGMTVLAGLIGIGLALLLSSFDIQSMFDVSIELAGLLGGGFAGAYTLGMFTRRANWQGVAIGVATSLCVTTIAWSMSLVHPYFYLAISIFVCIVVGYVASYLFPAPDRAALNGLTIYAKGDVA